ncbi:16S rRNA (guanine(527)-N(7))-methyltransferase RsmG [Flavisphingomonas formosensis]|uniref:16S rRNA (guanine(527)-N(7))-methyltransferase RsmG n=1 Tax=Flavisphingomonas formosensis TaxID=861534 RepID=UPI0012FC12E8|nr:16S rRNA (guanine(527)-N(7))-methyltransferase RsmG [Sphingomonas formosensis]
MTEEDARDWLNAALDVPRGTLDRIKAFLTLLKEEGSRQNLISASTLDHVWARHVVDSAQLIPLAEERSGDWLDLGSGAGFPGLIIGALTQRQVTLVESRRKRCAFLEAAIETLGVGDRVSLRSARVETLPSTAFSVISARAFAPLDRLLDVAQRFSTAETLWLLPKGRNAPNELDAARTSWQGDFRIAPSITDPDSAILILSDVRRRR